MRPETGGAKIHYRFDANGNYVGNGEMKVTLDDIRQKFDALCSGEESREAIADFASRARLQQEIEDEFRRGSVFFEPNLVVIPSVTRQNMEKAIEFLIQSGGVNSLSPE